MVIAGSDPAVCRGNNCEAHVQKARGEDKFKYHEYAPRPKQLMDSKDNETRKKANEELNKIFYSGSKKIGKY